MTVSIEEIYQKVADHEIDLEEAMEMTRQANRVIPEFNQTFHYDEAFLRDHIVMGERVLFGVAHPSLAIEAARGIYGSNRPMGLSRVLFREPVRIGPGRSVTVHIEHTEQNGRKQFRCIARDGSSEFDAAGGEYFRPGACEAELFDCDGFISRAVKTYSDHQIYGRIPSTSHGPSLRTTRKVYVNGNEALGELALSEEIAGTYTHYHVHPALLDGAFMTMMATVAESVQDPYVPLMIKALHVYGQLPGECRCHTAITKNNREIIEADLRIYDGSGRCLLIMNGMVSKRIHVRDPEAVQSPVPPGDVGRPQAGIDDRLLSEIENYLTRKIAKALGKPSASVNKTINFMDLGIESNKLVNYAQEFEKDLGVELYPTLFFEHQNLMELTQYLATEHRDELTARFNLAPTRRVGPETTTNEGLWETAAGEKPSAPVYPVPLGQDSFGRTEKAPPRPAASTDDIAIIGIGGVFSKSPDVRTFWENLREKEDMIEEVPLHHFDSRPWFDPEPRDGKMYCKWGSFIKDVDKFDAAFFNISPREAEVMDPQLRLLMQVLYNTAEDAGYAQRIKGTKTGVYVGVCGRDYQDEMNRLGVETPHMGTGTSHTMMANRPSYYFNITGPSMAIDTACSSSLVSLHVACNGLHNGECDTAFAAGTNLLLSPGHFRYFCSIRALSPTGRCHTFDKRADGYVPGEGVGALLLKRLPDALRDNDRIYALVKGSAVNHGGYTSTITAPSIRLESEVILEAWKNAGIDPETIGYIEAHGTGTSLGDPIEVEALLKAFRKHTNKKGFCALGSAKAHIGHTEGAAGITGVIKVVMSMINKEIPAMPDFRELNPYLKLEGSPLYINEEVENWGGINGTPQRAGVSSFGFGGAYAHVVLEAYENPDSPGTVTQQPERQVSAGSAEPHVVVLSAQNADRLNSVATALIRHLTQESDTEPGRLSQEDPHGIRLVDLAYTLQTGREEMPERMALIVSDIGELIGKLQAFVQGSPDIEDLYRSKAGGSHTEAELLVGRAGKEYLRILFEDRDLRKLARLWTSGVTVDWKMLYTGQTPRRISLPPYPFESEPFWIPGGDWDIIQKTIDTSGMDALRAASREQGPPMGETEKVVPLETRTDPPAPRAGEPNDRGARDRDAQKQRLKAYLNREILGLLKMDAALELDPNQSLVSLGMDSLLALQLKEKVEADFGRELEMAKLLEKEFTIENLVRSISAQVNHIPDSLPDSNIQPETPNEAVHQTEYMEGVI